MTTLIAAAVEDRDGLRRAARHRGSRGAQHHGGAPRAKPISREQALAALAEQVAPCTICRPDRDLGML
ncbi:DUF6233 domain-containing protein [Streptomyces sp. CA-135486]|uniref:DUF6233 domain-containing protein n=1 Tax=Streptomyces sp. CA-135486 TaxID=3240049 RepID=UPI003D8B456F